LGLPEIRKESEEVVKMQEIAELAEKYGEWDDFGRWTFKDDDRLLAFVLAVRETKQKPVAWHEPGAYGNVTTHKDWALANGWEPLYTAPREWVGLTHEEIDEISVGKGNTIFSFARAIEGKLKEKNA